MNTRPIQLAIAAAILAAAAHAQGVLRLYLDLDRATNVRESDLVVPDSTQTVTSIGFFAHATEPGLHASSIGYFGGIDRGIAVGHMPANSNSGQLIGISAAAAAPIIAGAAQGIEPDGMIMKVFDGPEFQYLEYGANTGSLPTEPQLVLEIEISLDGATPCDVFGLSLFDVVAAWAVSGGPYGAFTVSSWLDTGGDAVPDGTLTSFGIDMDPPVPVPPAAFLVDYIDGPASGGPATISITYLGDLDRDRDVDLTDLATLLADYGCVGEVAPCPADVNGDGDTNLTDLALLLSNFGAHCP